MRISSNPSAILICGALLLLSACGGQKNNGADVAGVNTAITITPGNSLLTVGKSQTYAAQNVFGTEYSWTVIPASLGTFTPNGTFTATTAGSGVIVASSLKDARYVGTTSLQTVAAPVATVTAPPFVLAGGTSLSASVPAQPNCTYSWTITGGTISGAADGPSITFAAGTVPGPLSLQCVVTNAAHTADTGTSTLQVVSLPVVTSFEGQPSLVAPGGTTSLIAVFSGGTGIVGPGNIPVVSGVPFSVSPSTTTSYTLTVTSPAGSQTSALASIIVGDPYPPRIGTIAPGTEWSDPVTGMVMVWCPPGTFHMGASTGDPDAAANEGPSHPVTFGQGFWISRTKVTQAEWTKLLNRNPAFFQPDACNKFFSLASLPVEQVSWEDVQGYLGGLNKAYGWHAYRLPSEAEWEYAYRAGTTTRFFWGEDPSLQNLSLYAWYRPNAFNLTQAVNQLAANAWNLKDIAGNVLEWTADAYQPDYTQAPTDGGAVFGIAPSQRTLRGSAWNDAGVHLRASARLPRTQSDAFRTIGFRLVRAHQGAPVLTSFRANTSSLPKGGGPVTLTWSATDATSTWLDHGGGDVSTVTSKTLTITSTTTFVLVVRNASGWAMGTAKVEVAK